MAASSGPGSSPTPTLPRVVATRLRQGAVIPAHPLALTAARRLDERRQRALTRYYLAAGAGGIAVGVHTTQFAIHDPAVGLYRPVLELCAETLDQTRPASGEGFIRIAGVAGRRRQAVREAELATDLGYHAALVSFIGLGGRSKASLLAQVRAVATVMPVVGFYLQPAVGGRRLPRVFWDRLLDIENLVAIKIAPFNRYETIEVARAVWESGRAADVALYTGNDDHIVFDLLTEFRFGPTAAPVAIVGGLLGQWAMWTRRAAELLEDIHRIRGEAAIPTRLHTLGAQLTDANGAIFDQANAFAGCLSGIHEVLRRQRLLGGRWCLDPLERLSPGQMANIDRVVRAYPHLTDDAFVTAHRDEWMR